MAAPQMAEAWDAEDSWTGVSSAAERRKLQNRIHQRAYRKSHLPRHRRYCANTRNSGKKRHLKRVAASTASATGSQAEDPAPSVMTVANIADPVTEQALALLENLPIFYVLRCHGIHQSVKEFLRRASTNWSLKVPSPRDLPTITRINAFDALARNAMILGIPVELLESDDGDSLFMLHGPPQPSAVDPKYPGQLSPTALQRMVKHHPWLDLLPIPGMRDNILRGIQDGVIDEDELCNELVCGMLNMDDTSEAGLIIWGDAWDVNGWELSPDFFTRYASLLHGCPEVLQATNHWRQKRGEMKIEFLVE